VRMRGASTEAELDDVVAEAAAAAT
jgi:hypothetical protein